MYRVRALSRRGFPKPRFTTYYEAISMAFECSKFYNTLFLVEKLVGDKWIRISIY